MKFLPSLFFLFEIVFISCHDSDKLKIKRNGSDITKANMNVSLSKQILTEVEGDINNDKILDTIRFIPVTYPNQVPYDFIVSIKYSYKGGFREKKIYSEKNVMCLFYGLKVVDNWVGIRFSDEALNDFTYNIAYLPVQDKFNLIRFFHVQPRNRMILRYNLFDEEFGALEVNAIRFCRITFKDNTILKDTLECPNEETECVFIPEEQRSEVDRYITTPLWTNSE